MINNPLLEAKYKVQKKLVEDSHHNLTEYAKMSHRIVEETEKKYGVKFIYGNVAAGSSDVTVRR